MLAKFLLHSKYTVLLTGAGMSTESGLPDFRSAAKGLWKQYNPLELATTEAMKNNRAEFITFYQNRIKGLQNCGPHNGHYILAEWERKGIVKAIITQNVDGFHQKAGSNKIAELHGTLRHCHCNYCGKIYENIRFLEQQTKCACGGFIRPSVVLFGESLPEEAIYRADIETKKADLFIVLGSSLQVSPANYFPSIAKKNGAKLIIINMESTPLDGQADLVIHNKKIGDVLESINI